jgi:hypothetical protein
VGGQLERDLVDERAPVPPARLQVLELALDDRVVARDEMIDVSG